MKAKCILSLLAFTQASHLKQMIDPTALSQVGFKLGAKSTDKPESETAALDIAEIGHVLGASKESWGE